jgi:putative toxin-antitoxin system antitoxin component (TIGR02293 family)
MTARKVPKKQPRGGTPKSGKPPTQRTGNAPIPGVSFLRMPDSLRVQLTGTIETIAVRDMITHSGVTGGVLRAVRERLGLTILDVSRVLGAGERTVIRKEQQRAPLSVTESDRAYRLARIADLAIEMIGDEARATAWLRTPSTYLGGETPVSMLDTEVGTDLVVESLYAIAHGGVA